VWNGQVHGADGRDSIAGWQKTTAGNSWGERRSRGSWTGLGGDGLYFCSSGSDGISRNARYAVCHNESLWCKLSCCRDK